MNEAVAEVKRIMQQAQQAESNFDETAELMRKLAFVEKIKDVTRKYPKWSQMADGAMFKWVLAEACAQSGVPLKHAVAIYKIASIMSAATLVLMDEEVTEPDTTSDALNTTPEAASDGAG